MAPKEYTRYTKQMSEEELRSYDDITSIHACTGFVTGIKRMNYMPRLKICIDNRDYYFIFDDVVKLAYRDIDQGDEVSVEYFRAPWSETWTGDFYVTRITNLTKNYSVVNKRFCTLLDYQKKNNDLKRKCHELLDEYWNEDFLFFVLSRKTESEDYKYVLQKIERPSEYARKCKNPFLSLYSKYTNNAELTAEARSFLDDCYVRGAFYNIPNSDVTIAFTRQTGFKRTPCRFCDSDYTISFSLPIGNDVGNYRYYCSHCFFEKNKIKVPEEFFVEE